MNIKDCEGCQEGCQTRINSDECIWFNESLDCPCASCLIKVMCLHRCELLKKHTDKIYKAMGIMTLEDKIEYIVEYK